MRKRVSAALLVLLVAALLAAWLLLHKPADDSHPRTPVQLRTGSGSALPADQPDAARKQDPGLTRLLRRNAPRPAPPRLKSPAASRPVSSRDTSPAKPRKEGALEGIVAAAGMPIPDVVVTVSGDGQMHLFAGPPSFKTDADGWYRAPNLAPGRYRASVSVPVEPSGVRRLTAVAIIASGKTTRLDFNLSGGGSLAGTVQVDGLIPDSCQITASTEWETATTELDAEGGYAFIGLSPGTVLVGVRAAVGDRHNIVSQVQAQIRQGETTRCDFDLAGHAAVWGMLSGSLDPSHAEVAAVHGRIQVPSRLEEWVAMFENPELELLATEAQFDESTGAYRCDNLLPGIYTVIAIEGNLFDDTFRSWRLASEQVELVDGEEAQVNLQLIPFSE